MIDPTCPACQEKHYHTTEEWLNHSQAGHGFSPETGWTGGTKLEDLPRETAKT
jgi:hypothetical protein